jgi:hypothetical protein
MEKGIGVAIAMVLMLDLVIRRFTVAVKVRSCC